MGEVHKLLTEQGKSELLRKDMDRRVVDAAAAYMATEESEIGFVYAGWAQASLPHRRLADDAHGQIQTDRVSLIVQPGLRAIPGQNPVSVGVPYGSRARLIILYLQTEAMRTGIRQIEAVASDKLASCRHSATRPNCCCTRSPAIEPAMAHAAARTSPGAPRSRARDVAPDRRRLGSRVRDTDPSRQCAVGSSILTPAGAASRACPNRCRGSAG